MRVPLVYNHSTLEKNSSQKSLKVKNYHDIHALDESM